MSTMTVTGYVCLLTGMAWGQEQLTLKAAIEQAERLNPDLATARLKTIETAALTNVTASGRQPQVHLIAQTAYQTSNLQGIGLVFPGFPSRIGPYRTFNARPQVTQSLLDLSLLSQVRGSRARQQLAELESRVVKDDLLIAVVQIYLQALQSQSRVEASAARIQTAEAILAQVRAKEQVGTGSKLDVSRAIQQLEYERAIQIDSRKDFQVLLTLLLRTIGREQTDAARFRLEKPGFTLLVESEVQQAAQDLRPDLLAQQARVKVAGLERKAIDQQKLPKIAAFGDYGLLGAGPDRSIGTYNVGITASMPLWTGRGIESESTAAQARVDQAALQAKKLKLQIQQEIRQASIELQSARESLQSAIRATAAAKEILELSRLRFESGLATSVDTQIAQSDVATVEDRRIQQEYAVLLSEAKLAKAGGALSLQWVK